MTAQLALKILMTITFVLVVLTIIKPNFLSPKKSTALNAVIMLVLMPLLAGLVTFTVLEKDGLIDEFRVHVSVALSVLAFFILLYIYPKIEEAERKKNKYIDVSEWNDEIERKKFNKSKQSTIVRSTKRK